jgi:hypothetical protein
MLKNMPRQTKSDFIVITDSRVNPNIKLDVSALLYDFKIPAKVFDSKYINRFCLRHLDLNERGQQFIEEYTMGMNINVQYYLFAHPRSFYTKILYLDEDILINKDLVDIFDNEQYAFYHYLLSAGVKCEDDFRHKKWRDFAECDFDTWIDQYINSGHRLYSFSDSFLALYKAKLEQFYNSKHFYRRWSEWQHEGKGKTWAFFQDQNFETAVAIKSGLINNNMSQYCRLVLSIKNPLKNLELYRDKHLTHYACGQDKIEFLKMLKNSKIIK